MININSFKIGKNAPCQLVTGPCTVDQNIEKIVKKLTEDYNIKFIRGGCWKPRSNPDSFTGFGKTGVNWLLKAATKYDVKVVFIEVADSHDIRAIKEVENKVGYKGKIVLWIGARTENQRLLQMLGSDYNYPVMIKNPIRPYSTNKKENNFESEFVKEWIQKRVKFVQNGRKEYDLKGNRLPFKYDPSKTPLLLCLRGLEVQKQKEQYRYSPEHQLVKTIKEKTNLPIGIDPSHSAGDRELVLSNLKKGLEYNPDFVFIESYLDLDKKIKNPPYCDDKKRQSIPLSWLPKVKKLINKK